MIKTIKVKKEMNFRELMEYILENDIRDREFTSRENEYEFGVCEDGIFNFYCANYNIGETYEVEVEEEITEDTEFEQLIVIDTDRNMTKLGSVTIDDIVNNYSYTSKIYALIGGELKLVWECE